MQLFKWFAEKVLQDTRSIHAFTSTFRGRVAQLLWDAVEEELPEPEFWRHWAALTLETGSLLSPMERVLRTFLQLRRDPHRFHLPHAGLLAGPDSRFRTYQKLLRGQITRLGGARGPSTARLPISAAGGVPSPDSLPRVDPCKWSE
jgi:hypothetical protein